jgi:hypothetical protein
MLTSIVYVCVILYDSTIIFDMLNVCMSYCMIWSYILYCF